jgi:hypothetical protein
VRARLASDRSTDRALDLHLLPPRAQPRSLQRHSDLVHYTAVVKRERMASLMSIPFSVEQFFAVFAKYNQSVWPMQVILNLPAVAAISLLHRARPLESRILSSRALVPVGMDGYCLSLRIFYRGQLCCVALRSCVHGRRAVVRLDGGRQK